MALEFRMGPNGIARPIDFVRLLKAAGLALDQAHEAVERVAGGKRVTIPIEHNLLAELQADAASLGVLTREVTRASVDSA